MYQKTPFSICSWLLRLSRSKSGFIPLSTSSSLNNSQQMFLPQPCHSFKETHSFSRGPVPILLNGIAGSSCCVKPSPQNRHFAAVLEDTQPFPALASCNLEIKEGSKIRVGRTPLLFLLLMPAALSAAPEEIRWSKNHGACAPLSHP